ncbi:MAG: hypothetical protein OEY11_10075 [Gammaproteobacteria bacterium]|nr:hypothetical protein [Gammaproteobacteria bacterium]
MKLWAQEIKLAAYIGLILIVTAAFSLITKAAYAASYSVKIALPDAELILNFDRSPGYKLHHSQQTQVIEFDHALDLPELQPAFKKLSAWLQTLSASYDAMLLRLQPGVTVALTVNDNSLHILLKSDREKHSPVRAPAKSSLALERVAAFLKMESGQPSVAAADLRALIEHYPKQAQLLLDMASVEQRLGRWREALALYERAEVLMPYSSIIKQSKASLLREYGSRLGTEVIYSTVGSQDTQYITTLQARKLMTNGYVWSLDYQRRDAKEEFDIRHSSGEIKAFEGERHHLSLGLESALNSGQQILSVFAGAKEPGLGWAYLHAGDYGQSAIEVAWTQPWYEIPEALVGYGYQHRLALSHTKIFWRQFSLSSDISFNRYGLEGVDDAAKSNRLQLYSRYWFVKPGSGFSFGYALDWEDVFYHAEREDAMANVFMPLPLASRELQVMDWGWNNRLMNKLLLAVQLGYEYERKRETSAPFGRITLNYQPDSGFEASANIQTGLSSYRGGEDEFVNVGGSIIWFF